MPRDKRAREPEAVPFGEDLGTALGMHAFERVRHFFNFIFYLDALCRRANALDPTFADEPETVFEAKATDQIDTGLRSTSAAYTDFDTTDPNILAKSATAFTRTDAAHFCNLGIKGLKQSRLATIASAKGDYLAASLLEMAKIFAGNTRQLPQRVNIGPDRIVDQLHAALAEKYFKAAPPYGSAAAGPVVGTPVLSKANLADYLVQASAKITAYHNGLAATDLGLAACAQCYYAVYKSATMPDKVWAILYGNVEGDFVAWGDKLSKAELLSSI